MKTTNAGCFESKSLTATRLGRRFAAAAGTGALAT